MLPSCHKLKPKPIRTQQLLQLLPPLPSTRQPQQLPLFRFLRFVPFVTLFQTFPSLFQSPLKGATIPYRPSQQHHSDDSCHLQQQQLQQQQQQQQQHFISKGSPPPTQTSSSLSPTPPPSSTTSCSRTDSPIMTSYTHPMVVMTSPYLNGGGGGGGGMPGDGSLTNAGPMCNGGGNMSGYFSSGNNHNHNNNNNNHIPTSASLYQPPPQMPGQPQQMSVQSPQPHMVKPFLNSLSSQGPPSAGHPLSSQYIYFPSTMPMTDPFAYSTLMSMGAGQPTISVSQSNLLASAAAASGPPLPPHFYSPSPFSGLEHYMNYKNGGMNSGGPGPFLTSPVQMNPERPMIYSSHVPDVSSL